MWLLPCGLLWILHARLQRYSTPLQDDNCIVHHYSNIYLILNVSLFNPFLFSLLSRLLLVLTGFIQPVTVTQWAQLPCSVTVMVPASAARALWATNVTNVSWTIITAESRTSVRNAQFAMALSKNRWVLQLIFYLLTVTKCGWQQSFTSLWLVVCWCFIMLVAFKVPSQCSSQVINWILCICNMFF